MLLAQSWVNALGCVLRCLRIGLGETENEAREVGVEGFVVLFYRRNQLVRSCLGDNRDRVRGSF